jgi:hypothetical protein
VPQLAPIAIFAYRRPRHIRRVLEALRACPEFATSDVTIFSDGPKTPEAAADVAQVREVLEFYRAPNVRLELADHNRGLAASIIQGVTDLTAEHGRAIVIEDDLIAHPAALTWLNAALDRYQDQPGVFHVSAYQWRVPEFKTRTEAVSLPFINSWGWATWASRWSQFDPAASGWEQLRTDPDLRRAFDQAGAFPLSEMLLNQMGGRIDSWAIRWWWSVFRNQGFAVFPPTSLITNIGFDATATHNTVGALKGLFAPPQPYLWSASAPPSCAPLDRPSTADAAALQRALKRTGAQRNARIKRWLRPLLKGIGRR